MRSKILAIIILSSFLIIPGIFYWYFFHQNTSSVTFRTSESGVEFDILLSGTFEYTYLPIADKALVFHEKCQSECTLVLPPVKYDVVLSSSGKEDIHENISLERGKTISVPVDFSQVFQFLPVSGVFDDETLMTASLQNANSSFSGKFFPVGIGMGSKIFTWREW